MGYVGDSPEDLIEPYELHCKRCGGTGNEPNEKAGKNDWLNECEDCRGAGVTLTDAGEKLYEFMDKYFRQLARTNLGDILRID